MVGSCSATGLSTARGIGAELILREPAPCLYTIAILVGPLLLLQAATLIGLTTVKARRSIVAF